MDAFEFIVANGASLGVLSLFASVLQHILVGQRFGTLLVLRLLDATDVIARAKGLIQELFVGRVERRGLGWYVEGLYVSGRRCRC